MHALRMRVRIAHLRNIKAVTMVTLSASAAPAMTDSLPLSPRNAYKEENYTQETQLSISCAKSVAR